MAECSLYVLQHGLILVFFSPIPKTMAQAISWVRTGLEHNTASRLRLLGMRNYQNESTERLAAFLSANLRQSDGVFLWGNYAKMYLDVKRLPPTFCIASPLLMAPWAPQIWKERMMDELGKAAPAYFIAEHNDGKFFMSGSLMDSYTYLMHWTSLREYLFTNYTLVDSSEHFTIYSRNKDS